MNGSPVDRDDLDSTRMCAWCIDVRLQSTSSTTSTPLLPIRSIVRSSTIIKKCGHSYTSLVGDRCRVDLVVVKS